MSQATTWGVPEESPSTPAAFAARANGALGALLSQHRGASRPAYAAAGMLWLDDASEPWTLKAWDGAADRVILTINPTSGEVRWPASTASRAVSSTALLLQAKALFDHVASDDHDGRYDTKAGVDAKVAAEAAARAAAIDAVAALVADALPASSARRVLVDEVIASGSSGALILDLPATGRTALVEISDFRRATAGVAGPLLALSYDGGVTWQDAAASVSFQWFGVTSAANPTLTDDSVQMFVNSNTFGPADAFIAEASIAMNDAFAIAGRSHGTFTNGASRLGFRAEFHAPHPGAAADVFGRPNKVRIRWSDNGVVAEGSTARVFGEP